MVQLSLEQLVDQVDAAAPNSSPLRRLTLAVVGSELLTSTADDLVGHFVEKARAEGASWAEIGAAMGVSKQAAQQRHVGREDSHDEPPFDMDDDTRAALTQAHQEARDLNHLYVGTEHLLVGVLRLSAPLTAAVGLTADAARDAAVALVGRGGGGGLGQPGFTARARKVMELAHREAHQLGAAAVSPGHVILAILREGTGIAAQIIPDHDTVRSRVLTALAT